MNSELAAIKPKEPRLIGGSTSVFLDSLRILATLVVLYVHAHEQWYFPNGGHPFTWLDAAAHMAVVVFFVLSGYVIAFSTTKNNRGWRQYAQARLSRLSSVVIPALLITALVAIVIKHIDLAISIHYNNRGLTWQRYIISGAFLNEVWFFSAAPPLNGPLWSLSFEFWYYTIFGGWLYKGKGLKAYLIPLLTCLIAGPKILVMMPIWIAGCIAYSLNRPELSAAKAWLIIAMLLITCVFVMLYCPQWPFTLGSAPFFFAGQFITDWIIGALIAIAFWILPNVKNTGSTSVGINAIRKVADVTFPIYVLHNPLLILWRAIFHGQTGNAVQMWEAIFVVLIISIFIGIILEWQRFVWINFFKYIFNSAATKLTAK